MTIDMSQFYEVFFDEAEELLAEAERLLLAIDINAPEDEDLNAIFRAAHSIKGGAATFGFMDMTEITHVLENLLDKIRKHEMALTAEHVDAFLAAKDVLKMELDGHRHASEVNQEQVADVKMMLKSLSEADGVVIAPTPKLEIAPAIEVSQAEPKEVQSNDDATPTFVITLPEVTDKDLKNLKEELSLLGEISSQQLASGLHELTLSSNDATKEDIISICSFIVDPAKLNISKSGEAKANNTNLEVTANEPTKVTEQVSEEDLGYGFFDMPEPNPVIPQVTETQVVTESKVSKMPITKVEVHEEEGYGLFAEPGKENQEEGFGFFAPFKPHPDAPKAIKIGDDTPAAELNALQKTPETSTNSVASSNPVAEDRRATSGRRETDKGTTTANAETTSIRVGIEKVDQLINLVGELVITQAMIEQRISALDPVHHEKLINSVSQLTRNTRDLQESVMSIRMMPMDFVFSRFPRMVRDLAAKLGKKVDFVTQGATTELDKGLIERIVDPLTHLVRNSVDHGIESPANRKAAGKSETGRLMLSAAHKGGSIVIEVTDDGGGLNRDKLLAKAQSNGLPVSENMTDSEVYNLIFAPGFSTAEVVTDVSGRGVGMDVVKRNITAMGGTVEIRSALGFGTTVSIALPLTLAILDGMSISLSNSLYVVPLNLIVETMQPRMQDIKTVTGEGLMVNVRGEYLPIIPLYALFNQDTEITHPTEGVLLILEAEGKKAALFVDRLVGQQQVVIKSLETNFRKIAGVSGATIMGDGSVALILDVPAIIKMGQNNSQGVYQ